MNAYHLRSENLTALWNYSPEQTASFASHQYTADGILKHLILKICLLPFDKGEVLSESGVEVV
jgi:hypothetical protein